MEAEIQQTTAAAERAALALEDGTAAGLERSRRYLEAFAVGTAEVAQRRWWGLADRLMAKFSNGCARVADCVSDWRRADCSERASGEGRSARACDPKRRYVCKGEEGDRISLGYPDWRAAATHGGTLPTPPSPSPERCPLRRLGRG